MASKIGCGITTYNRPHADKELVKSIKNADTVGVDFYVFNDKKEFPEAYHGFEVFSTKHLGMPRNTWRCINYVFDHHNIGFFLENDIAIAKDYFPVMREILNRYGGVISSTFRPRDGEPIKEVDQIATNWATTKDVWLKTKPLLEEYIEDIGGRDYANLSSGYEMEKYGTSTQSGVRNLKFREAGYKIWQTSFPKVRITCTDGFHGQKPSLLEVSQAMINE